MSNSYADRRVLAYERIKYLLESYGLTIKLYGSCACGIALETSDLDIAVDSDILENMFGYASSGKQQVQ